jgi:hypothetical protein
MIAARGRDDPGHFFPRPPQRQEPCGRRIMNCNPAQITARRLNQIGRSQKCLAGYMRKLPSLRGTFAEPLTDLVSHRAAKIRMIEDRG